MKKLLVVLSLILSLPFLISCRGNVNIKIDESTEDRARSDEPLSFNVKTELFLYDFGSVLLSDEIESATITLTGEIPSISSENGDFSGQITIDAPDGKDRVFGDFKYYLKDNFLMLYDTESKSQAQDGTACWIDLEDTENIIFYTSSWNVLSTLEIYAYLDNELSLPEAQALGTKINMIEGVQSTMFITREEALESFVSKQEDPEMFNDLPADTLQHRYVIVVSAEEVETVRTLIEKIDGVDAVPKVPIFNHRVLGRENDPEERIKELLNCPYFPKSILDVLDR